MDEDDGRELDFDEVDMQDVVNEWAKTYAEGVEVGGWYYDCHSQTLVIRLLVEEQESEDA